MCVVEGRKERESLQRSKEGRQLFKFFSNSLTSKILSPMTHLEACNQHFRVDEYHHMEAVLEGEIVFIRGRALFN